MELNPKAEQIFNVKSSNIVGEIIPAIYGSLSFEEAKEQRIPIETKCTGHCEDVKVEMTVVYLEHNNMYIAFLKDISEAENNKEELTKLRLSTVGLAQQVIDKQMRVAQEIASLLGETTAETKVALTNLKRSINEISEG